MDRLELSLGDKGVVGLVNGSEELTDLAALQTRAPDAPAADLARVAAALGKPGYDPILDPEAYKTRTMARFEAEDPAMPWRPGVMRIRDFGLPDFASIEAPRLDAGALVFFARDTHTGLPVRVSLPIGTAGDATFDPLPLTPVGGDPVPVPADIAQAALGPKRPGAPVPKDLEDDEGEDGEP